MVVHLLVAVEMDRPREERARLILRQLLVHQQRVGAQIDELFPRNDAANDFGQLFMEEWFATGDRNHRRAAFVDRVQGIFHRHVLVQDRIGIVDFSAAGASQVAPEQGLKHQHERIALAASQTLANNVATDIQFLKKGNAQDCYPY